MKNFKIYLAYVALLAMVMTSCSKEDNPDSPDGPAGDEMATLGFTALLEDFDRGMLTKQAVPGTENAGLPECPDDVDGELFVRVRLLDSNGDLFTKDGESYFDVPVIPQDDGSWLTGEGENDELELPEGVYQLDYFGVYGPDGDDDDSDPDLLYIAPRENDDYGPSSAYANFVDDALPSAQFSVMNGQKKYVDVEVLCYDDHFVQQYGYLFFDFEEVDILYLCLFGNVCDTDGRHTPAVFRFDVWNYSGEGANPKGSKLFSAQNSLETGIDLNEQPYTYTEPVCVQLPDDPNENDMYYGEVSLWTAGEEGEEGSWEVIRFGAFDETEVESLYISDPDAPGDSESNYYHFREGSCSNQDDSNPCLFKSPIDPPYTNDFEAGLTAYDNTDYTEDASGAANSLWEEGEWAFTTNPSFVHNNWIDEAHDGNMMIFNGAEASEDDLPRVYYSYTEADVCPDADYFMTFEIRNVLGVSSGSENDVQLQVVVDGETVPGIITADNGPGSDWVTVALRLKADNVGELHVALVDAQTAANGNDFAIDNIVISNDPDIIEGDEDITLVQLD